MACINSKYIYNVALLSISKLKILEYEIQIWVSHNANNYK